jgi:hypothetical protein
MNDASGIPGPSPKGLMALDRDELRRRLSSLIGIATVLIDAGSHVVYRSEASP